jgi:heme oxygenase (biliverdin-IX-beta and delta-forming)
MLSAAGAKSPEDQRFALKRATDAAHARVEGIIEAAEMFRSLDGYRRYLQGSYAARSRLEHRLDAAGAEKLWPDWPRRRIAHLIAADIDDLGGIALAPLESLKSDLTAAELLGLLYVLEGSSLGARVLVTMTDSLGLTASFGARHLHEQAGDRSAWRSFITLLNTAGVAPSTEAALSAFDVFAEAYAGAHSGELAV